MLFPHLRGLRVGQVEDTGDAVVIRASCRAAQARCPLCGAASSRVHAGYARVVADGAAGGRPVLIALSVQASRGDGEGPGQPGDGEGQQDGQEADRAGWDAGRPDAEHDQDEGGELAGRHRGGQQPACRRPRSGGCAATDPGRETHRATTRSPPRETAAGWTWSCMTGTSRRPAPSTGCIGGCGCSGRCHAAPLCRWTALSRAHAAAARPDPGRSRSLRVGLRAPRGRPLAQQRGRRPWQPPGSRVR